MNEPRKGLILTMGLPRSGKTTWARKQNLPIVNPDSIRLALHGQVYIQEAEGIVWEVAYLMVKSLFLAGHSDVIVDAANITKKRRKVWVDKFAHECAIIIKVFNTSKEVCIMRAKKDEREDLIPIIERMAENWEEPKNDGCLYILRYGNYAMEREGNRLNVV